MHRDVSRKKQGGAEVRVTLPLSSPLFFPFSDLVPQSITWPPGTGLSSKRNQSRMYEEGIKQFFLSLEGGQPNWYSGSHWFESVSYSSAPWKIFWGAQGTLIGSPFPWPFALACNRPIFPCAVWRLVKFLRRVSWFSLPYHYHLLLTNLFLFIRVPSHRWQIMKDQAAFGLWTISGLIPPILKPQLP